MQGKSEANETTLNKLQLDGLLTGNTVFIDLPAGGPGGPTGGVAICYFGKGGRAHFKLPTGTTLVGPWFLEVDHYRADWDNGPKNSCTRLVKSDGKINVIDATSGNLRGHITRIVPGNSEQV